MRKASFTSDVFEPDRLIAGNAGLLVTWPVTVASGQNLERGAVLGKITASGKYVLSLSASEDGSETPDLVLAEDTDASAGDTVTIAYAAGHFNERALTIGTGHTADSIREGLRVKGIMLIPSLPA